MLRKRLELLMNKFTDKKYTAKERLEKIFRTEFSKLPLECTITLNSKDYTLPVFIEVLRHSLWRPREILIYFTRILTILKDFTDRNITINNFSISKVISDTTREIIKSEFISELQRHCINIIEILRGFKGKPQILNIEPLNKLIGNLHFQFIDKMEPLRDFKKKVKFLFEIGFIGLEVSKQLVRLHKLLIEDVFCFNETNDTYEILENNDYEECNFVIHPLFCEFLGLDTSNNQRLTLNMSWQYLENQEAHVILLS